jgi:hypothetical protein
MSDPRTGSLTLRPAAAAALLIGALLLLASWDGLYDTLDLPQPLPALAAQVGGAALIGLAYLLWSARRVRSWPASPRDRGRSRRAAAHS